MGRELGGPAVRKGRFTIGLNVVDGAAHGSRNVAFNPDRRPLEYAILSSPATGVTEIRSEMTRTGRDIARQDPWLRVNPPRIDWPMRYPGGRIVDHRPQHRSA
ncbi:hypothetical protein [Streptomyces sp. ML-6]|uniref:hypothetical protein n=1 Tax=Streptomyces sp. ML-6 TaxID=2982693 RepID=UPI0024C09AD1|nr:hypothetical protein [Streptomyces sp. ML-6]MDK0523882.1 hypothetical protein [Streptomyces sp. ML-6]